MRLLDVGGPDQVAGQMVDPARHLGLSCRLRRLQFRMMGPHTPHAAFADPRQSLAIVLPAPTQLPGNLPSSPDRVCLLELADGMLDLARRPPRTAFGTGQTVSQAG